MKHWTTRSGQSLAIRLMASVVLPFLALSLLGYQRIESARADVADAHDVAERAGILRSVAAVVGPSQLEQIALEGLARLDEIGVPRAVVVDIAGVDLQATYDENRVRFDEALDHLATDHGGIVLSDGHVLAERLTDLRAQVDHQRELVAAHSATQPDISVVFESLERTLDDTLASTAPLTSGTAGSRRSTSDRIRLDALRDVTEAAGSRGRALLVELTRHDDRAPLDPAFVRDAADAFLNQLDYLDDLDVYSNEVHTAVTESLDADAREAEAAVLWTWVLLVGILIASVGLSAMVGWSVLVPIRRLTRRARSMTEGRLTAEPLPISGSSDIRMLTRSMNDMSATLHTIETQLASLATGDEVPSGPVTPGAIGVSIRRSFENLERTAARLHASEQLASAIVEQAYDSIWMIDAAGVIRSANRTSTQLLGISADDQVGRPISDHLQRLDGVVRLCSDGEADVHLLVTSRAIDGGPEPLVAVVAHDISERMRFEKRLAYQANHDALTSLPNRFALLQRIERLAPGRAAALLFLDLDGFKAVNDVHGHVAGDHVLQQVGVRLSALLGNDDFVGRFGGDEFVIVLGTATGLDDATAFAERIIREIERPYDYDTQVFCLSASVGVAAYPHGLAATGTTALDAIGEADAAVYQAKRHGRGCVEVFDHELQSSIINDAELEIALRAAITDGELEMYLQPVGDLAAGRFTSAEALVRWNRPGHGMMLPTEFVPIAERSSLVLAIDRWMLHSVCSTLARWQRETPGSSARIAMNISGRHLVDGHLLRDLEAALHATSADPRFLDFELTETQLIEDLDRATLVLEQVRALGIGIAVDDFGTGHSSISYLQRLPIDILKIDRSFTALVTEDPDTGTCQEADTKVLDALLTIGHALDVTIVAEGIETPAQLEFLRSRHCDRVQGFLLAGPMPVDLAEGILGTELPTAWRSDLVRV